MTIRLRKPDNLNPTLLWQQMKDAGLTDTNWMYADQDETGMGTEIEFLDLPDSAQAKIEEIFAAHTAAADAENTRQVTSAYNENSTRDLMDAALAANKTFLALTAPTNVQNANQLKALTRQVNGIIRTLRDNFTEVD